MSTLSEYTKKEVNRTLIYKGETLIEEIVDTTLKEYRKRLISIVDKIINGDTDIQELRDILED